MNRSALLALLLLAACSDDKPAAKPKVASGTAADPAPTPKPAPIVELPRADPLVVRPVQTDLLVVIARDGSLSRVRNPQVGPDGLDLTTLTAEPIQIEDLKPAPPPPPPPPPKQKNPPPDDPGVVGGEILDGDFATITGTGDISSGFDDADIYGGLLGNEAGEMQGGFGYGRTGSGRSMPAGIRGRSLLDGELEGRPPLVLVDTGAPADRLEEVLAALPISQLAITTDGVHAHTLAVLLEYVPGQPTTDDGSDRVRWDPGATAGPAVDQIATLVRAKSTSFGVGKPLAGSWGTIGTGRYGTIGHGSGTGEGYGVGGGRGGMRGRAAAVPAVRIGQPSMTGNLDKAVVRRYIKRNLPKIKYCYEKELLAKPGLQGTVATQFVISKTGTVSSAQASGIDEEVSDCVARVIKSIEFPKPKGGGDVTVTSYPFEFRPSGG